MPSPPAETVTHDARPNSWSTSPIRQLPPLDDDNSTDDDESDVALLHRHPLTYFFTPPTPPVEEDMEFDFDFDAGIEDPNSPKEIVRSISPSTLDGLQRYKPRGRAGDCAIIDDDEDDEDEDYIRFQPNKSLLDFGFGRPSRASCMTMSQAAKALLTPTTFHIASPRGRPHKRFSPPRRVLEPRTLQRRHSWREPSPDVWSIEEEPELETRSEMGLSVENLDFDEPGKSRPIDIPAAKPKKKVRFVLPVS